MSQVIL